MAGAVEARADRMTTDGYDGDTAVRVRLVPQIPLRDAIQTHSRLGGRPHLPAATDWPRIDGVKGDFLAQIACADLPQGLWAGLGPRDGWLAFFAHPVTGGALALHPAEDGPPRRGPADLGDDRCSVHGADNGWGSGRGGVRRARKVWME